ncbi:MAG: DUF5367 family protein [Flavobacteriaceae bacterium]
MKTFRAIMIGAGVWFFAVAFYTLSYQFPILENRDEQANLVLLTVVLPLVWLGSHIYYKKDTTTHGIKIGQVLLLTAAFLDAVITVPLFIIPNGGSHSSFFLDPGFWIIAFEMIATAVLYYYITIYPKIKSLKQY